MTNKARGESRIMVGQKAWPVALTLGTLAAIEEAFGVESYDTVFEDFVQAKSVSAAKVMKIIAVVLGQAGHPEPEAAAASLNLHDMVEITLDMLRNAFPAPKAGKKAVKPRNP